MSIYVFLRLAVLHGGKPFLQHFFYDVFQQNRVSRFSPTMSSSRIVPQRQATPSASVSKSCLAVRGGRLLARPWALGALGPWNSFFWQLKFGRFMGHESEILWKMGNFSGMLKRMRHFMIFLCWLDHVGSSSPNCLVVCFFFPTCQVRVVRFYVSWLPPPPSAFRRLPPPPDLNHDHPRQVFPAGPQPRASTPSVPCRTSTATIHAQCSLPDLNLAWMLAVEVRQGTLCVDGRGWGPAGNTAGENAKRYAR